MSANLIPPNERSGRRTYANAKWRDMQNKYWPWYGIRPDASGGFKVVNLFNHAEADVANNFVSQAAAQEWMEKNIAP